MKANLPYTQQQIAEIRSWVKDCRTWPEARSVIESKTGKHPDNITRMNKKHGFWRSEKPPVSTQRSNDTMDASIELSDVQTVEEVIKLCGVDTEKWESKGFSVSKRQNGFGWSARFAKKKEPTDVNSLLEAFAEQAEKHAPAFPVKPIKTKTGDRLLEMSIPDLHLAKLCWGLETGHKDYDIKIAADLYRQAVSSLLASARDMNIGRILLPIGNDLMNSDNAAGTTTAGTPQAQSEDSRWKKTFMTACGLIVDAVEQLATEFPVDVVVVAGNHDQERCFYLGEYVKSWFRNHPNVNVDNSATQRKYYHFGSTLIGFTHGNEEKPAKLPLIMANEQKQKWSETTHHEWHLGHQHRTIVTEDVGCKVRWLPSLCPPDEWMAAKGYIGNDQAAEGFVYDRQSGLIASLYFRAS